MGEPEENDSTIVSSSEMCRDGSATIIWHLKGWKEHANFLKDNAVCVVEVPSVISTDGEEEPAQEENKPEEESGDETPPTPPVKFRFYFGNFARQVESKYKQWFSLWVSLLNEQKQTSFLVEVVEVDEEEDPDAEAEGEEDEGGDENEEDSDDDEDIVVNEQITISLENKKGDDDGVATTVVKEEFLPMSWWKTDGNGNKTGDEHLTEWAESEELKFKITVTLYHYSGSDIEVDEVKDEEQPEEEAEEEEPIPMIRDLKAMYSMEENYADVSLETRDGMILNAHKFVLAARSSYFRGIIEKEVKKKGFTGFIKLGNVDGKPMSVVLHWMYTDEILEEQLGKVMDEVIKVSVKWELKDLLKMLDKKLISVCNTRNMLHLFQVAHKNGLYTAIADISEYIKQNIDSVLPTRRPD